MSQKDFDAVYHMCIVGFKWYSFKYTTICAQKEMQKLMID